MIDDHVGITAAAPPSLATESTALRQSHVLVLNSRRELIVRRVPISAAGMPHADALTSAVVAEVRRGESYELAAARGLREQLGARVGALRHVGTTWLDEGGARVFLAVFVAAYDGPFDDAALRAAPLHDVFRATRRGDAGYTEAFARAVRVLRGDDEW